MAKRLLLFIIVLAVLIWASPATAQMATLDSYVRAGLAGNLALQQQNFSYEKNEQALRQAPVSQPRSFAHANTIGRVGKSNRTASARRFQRRGGGKGRHCHCE